MVSGIFILITTVLQRAQWNSAPVGKIGIGGAPFVIGSSFTLTADTVGDLYLAVNDFLPIHQDI